MSKGNRDTKSQKLSEAVSSGGNLKASPGVHTGLCWQSGIVTGPQDGRPVAWRSHDVPWAILDESVPVMGTSWAPYGRQVLATPRSPCALTSTE